ncbi:MAG: hypothetical protein KC466_15635, partial [Myxococcales bacterium]|nr:hypothetical protein [Myxococcales bacterium]
MRWWTWAFGIWLVAAPAFAADEGRALVARGAAAHGGVARFRALGVVAARIDDDWTWIGRAWSDWPIDPAQGVVRADFGLHKALLVFDRPAGLRWGFDSVGGWSAVDGARVLDSKTDGRASFMLRTIGYYWTLPFRFLEAGARYRALGIREDFGESW